MKRTWTDEAIARLRERYPTHSNESLAPEFGVSANALVTAARRYGVKKTKAYLAGIARGAGRKPTMRSAFIAACSELFEYPEGASRSDCIAQTGLAVTSVHGFLSKAKAAGELHAAGVLAQMRYYLTPEAAAAGSALIAAQLAERKLRAQQRKRARAKAKYVPKPKVAKPPKPPRAAKVKAIKPPKPPKPIVFAKPKKPAPIRFADLPVVIPAHIKVQRLPGYDGTPKWARETTW